MRRTLKYIFKLVGGLLLILLLVVLLISLLIQLKPVKNQIARIAEQQTSKYINGELSIGELDGNFFTEIHLERVLLKQEGDTLAHVGILNLRYNLLSLLDGVVDLHSARIENPYIYLQQLNDSVWNFQNLTDSTDESPATTESGSIDIRIPDFRLLNGEVKIASADSMIPQRIHSINTLLSLVMTDGHISAEMDEFSLATENPGIMLNQLTFKVEINEEQVELNDFIMSTAHNTIEGHLLYQMKPDQSGFAEFNIGELHLSEFEYFLPDFSFAATPGIQISGELIQDSVSLSLWVNDQNQSIEANILSGNLYEYLLVDTTAILRYHIETFFRNIEPGYWMDLPELNYVLNGNIVVSGSGTDPDRADLSLKANLNESFIEGQEIDILSADLLLNHGNVDGEVQAGGAFGNIMLDTRIKSLLDDPSYHLNFEAANINIATLTGNDTLMSNINLRANLNGKSFEPENISAGGEVIIYNSSFQQFILDTLFTQVHFADETITIDTLHVASGQVNARAAGFYSLNDLSDIQLFLQFDGLKDFEDFLPIDGLNSSGTLEAGLSGNADSLELDAVLMLDSTQVDTLSFGGLHLIANGSLTPADTIFDVNFFLHNLNLGSFSLDSVSANIEGSPDSVFLQTELRNEEINTRLHASVVPGEQLRITLPLWEIEYKDLKLALQETPAFVEIDSANYRISNFRLATNNSDSAQYILMEGLISRQVHENFHFEAGNLDIIQLAGLTGTELNGSGLADFNFDVTGTPESPSISGGFQIRNAEFNQYSFNDFKGTFDLNNNLLSFESLVIPQDSGRFEIVAQLPLQVNLDTMGFYFSPDDSLLADVLIDKFALAVLNSFEVPVETTGYLEGNVKIRGTANAPNPEGGIRLVDASFSMNEFGIDYREVKLNLNFLRDRIALDTLYIATSDGNLNGTGAINFGSDFYKGDITDTKIDLNFNGFNPFDHRQFNMQVEGTAELKGEGEEVVFGGDIKIPQAEFYLPAIFRLMGRMGTAEMPKPLLLQELESMEEGYDTITLMQFTSEDSDSVSFDYFDQLKGSLRVRIPRNTWVKNDDMRLELSGELEVMKNSDFFELFGQVEVVRGQYELLGRVFEINEGGVYFEGGEDFNFRIDIEAAYKFRNSQKVQQELTIHVLGTPEEPEVNFELNGNSIDEGDALSYILFGKSMDELSLNEQDNMERSGVGSLAGQAAASLVSAQLTSFLQDKLDVDYIEVKSEGGFTDASVVVGKYLTNRLFVSYEQRFGQTDDQSLKKYEVKLEYELFRFLFFELNNSTIDSGFDVIFKFDIL